MHHSYTDHRGKTRRLFSEEHVPTRVNLQNFHRPAMIGVRGPEYDTPHNINPEFLRAVFNSAKGIDIAERERSLRLDCLILDLRAIAQRSGKPLYIAANASIRAPRNCTAVSIYSKNDERFIKAGSKVPDGWIGLEWTPPSYDPSAAWGLYVRFAAFRVATRETPVIVANGSNTFETWVMQALEGTELCPLRQPGPYTITFGLPTLMNGSFTCFNRRLSQRAWRMILAMMREGGCVYGPDEFIVALDRPKTYNVQLPSFVQVHYVAPSLGWWNPGSTNHRALTTEASKVAQLVDLDALPRAVTHQLDSWMTADSRDLVIWLNELPGTFELDYSNPRLWDMPVRFRRRRNLKVLCCQGFFGINPGRWYYLKGDDEPIKDTTTVFMTDPKYKIWTEETLSPYESCTDVLVRRPGRLPNHHVLEFLTIMAVALDKAVIDPMTAVIVEPAHYVRRGLTAPLHSASGSPVITLNTAGVIAARVQPEQRLLHKTLALGVAGMVLFNAIASTSLKTTTVGLSVKWLSHAAPLVIINELWSRAATNLRPWILADPGEAQRRILHTTGPSKTQGHRISVQGELDGLLLALRSSDALSEELMAFYHKLNNDIRRPSPDSFSRAQGQAWILARRSQPKNDFAYRGGESWPGLREPSLAGLYFNNPAIVAICDGPCRSSPRIQKFVQQLGYSLARICRRRAIDRLCTITASYDNIRGWLPGPIISLEASTADHHPWSTETDGRVTKLWIDIPGGITRHLGLLRLVPWCSPFFSGDWAANLRFRVLNGRVTPDANIRGLAFLEECLPSEAVCWNKSSYASWMLNCSSAMAGSMRHLEMRLINAIALAGHVYGTDEAILVDQHVYTVMACAHRGALLNIHPGASIPINVTWLALDPMGRLSQVDSSVRSVSRTVGFSELARAAMNVWVAPESDARVCVLVMGTRGDRTSPSAWVRSLCEAGIDATLEEIDTESEGRRMLRAVEQLEPAVTLEHLIKCTKRAQIIASYYGVTIAPSGLPGWPGLTYTMAPVLTDAKPPTGPYKGLVGNFVALYTLLPFYNLWAGSAFLQGFPRSADGLTPLQRFEIDPGPAGMPARDLRMANGSEVFIVAGSSSIPAPEWARGYPVLGNKDHAQAGALIHKIIHSGSAGVAYTFAKQGCQVDNWSTSHDRRWVNQPSLMGCWSINLGWDMSLLSLWCKAAAEHVNRPRNIAFWTHRCRIFLTRGPFFLPLYSAYRAVLLREGFVSPLALVLQLLRSMGTRPSLFAVEVFTMTVVWYLSSRFEAGLARQTLYRLWVVLHHPLWPLLAWMTGPLLATTALMTSTKLVEYIYLAAQQALYVIMAATRTLPTSGRWLAVRRVKNYGFFLHVGTIDADAKTRREGVFTAKSRNPLSWLRPMQMQTLPLAAHEDDWYFPVFHEHQGRALERPKGWGPFNNCVTLLISELWHENSTNPVLLLLVLHFALITPITVLAVVFLGVPMLAYQYFN